MSPIGIKTLNNQCWRKRAQRWHPNLGTQHPLAPVQSDSSLLIQESNTKAVAAFFPLNSQLMKLATQGTQDQMVESLYNTNRLNLGINPYPLPSLGAGVVATLSHGEAQFNGLDAATYTTNLFPKTIGSQ